MPNFLSVAQPQPTSSLLQSSRWRWQRVASILPLLILGMTIGAGRVEAQSASPAPAELLQTLAQIDAAASQGKLPEVMAFYSPAFTNSDGMTYATLQDALKQLWQQHPNLTYTTQINTWRSEGNAIIAETTTTIATAPAPTPRPAARPAQPPVQPTESALRPLSLQATITARQRFENQTIVQQEILAEQSQLTSGEKPPTVTVYLPDQVKIGQSYDFDAVVAEPLGDRLLLGAALEEPIQASGYLNPTPVELELLSSGGLFKVGRAPRTAENRWVSAIIVRDDGITTVSQRLRVVPLTAPAAPQPPAAP
ncbi:MAG TPA: nuclear transport factor 2 family protein [Coleofasciculaceae cyanobacterium]